MKPEFRPGKNIALKVPAHEFEKTVHFYGVVLGLERRTDKPTDAYESVVFDFGDKNLWVDKSAGISQAEIWLEIQSDDVEQAKHYLLEKGSTIINEIEPLPPSLNGFWLCSPSNIVHLVVD